MRRERRRTYDERLESKAMELFRRLEQIPEVPRFDGATIDYHWDKPAVVFIPEKELIAEVENGELLQFLRRHSVKRVLVDALWPTNAGVVKELIENGVEVCVLTRPSALHGWWKKGNKGKPRGLVEWLMRHHPEALRGFKEEIKNDIYDAVLLRYVKPKFVMRVTEDYLECWPKMILFRHARRSHQTLVQQLAVLPIPEDEKGMRLKISEHYLMVSAADLVATVRRHHPKVDELFQRLGIEDDLIVQAYACELVVEAHGSRTLAEFLRKLGLTPGMPSKNEEDGGQKKRAFIHDKQAGHTLNQLVLKIYRLDPRREQNRIKGRCKKVAEAIWRWKESCI